MNHTITKWSTNSTTYSEMG